MSAFLETIDLMTRRYSIWNPLLYGTFSEWLSDHLDRYVETLGSTTRTLLSSKIPRVSFLLASIQRVSCILLSVDYLFVVAPIVLGPCL